jgi:hypothetical protein
MYTTCPKCQYQRQLSDEVSTDLCPACGLVFSKWFKNLLMEAEISHAPQLQEPESKLSTGLKRVLFAPRPDIAKGDFYIYLFIWLIFFAWGIDFVMMDFQTNEIGRTWFHNVDLVFHEAGHVLFIPFGRTMTILGGSLLQVLLPLMLVAAFLGYNKDGFAASMCLWWAGQSMMDVAPYIADARALILPLLGGGNGADRPGSHDWENLLKLWGVLDLDIAIARWVDAIGSGILLLALAWGAYMLYVHYHAAVK